MSAIAVPCAVDGEGRAAVGETVGAVGMSDHTVELPRGLDGACNVQALDGSAVDDTEGSRIV